MSDNLKLKQLYHWNVKNIKGDIIDSFRQKQTALDFIRKYEKDFFEDLFLEHIKLKVKLKDD